VPGGRWRSHGLDVEPVRVVRREVLLNFLDDVGVVRAVLVEPKDDRRVARARAGHRELHPVLDRRVFRLRHAEHGTLLHRLREDHLSIRVGDDNIPCRGELEGLVVTPVLLRLLRHEAHIRNGAHRRRVERTILLAELHHFLEHARI